jgi:hypothetical protein
VELVRPESPHYSPSQELVNMARLFSVVLGAFAPNGRVRTAKEYVALFGRVVGKSSVEEISLFPMPARLFLVKF